MRTHRRARALQLAAWDSQEAKRMRSKQSTGPRASAVDGATMVNTRAVRGPDACTRLQSPQPCTWPRSTQADVARDLPRQLFPKRARPVRLVGASLALIDTNDDDRRLRLLRWPLLGFVGVAVAICGRVSLPRSLLPPPVGLPAGRSLAPGVASAGKAVPPTPSSWARAACCGLLFLGCLPNSRGRPSAVTWLWPSRSRAAPLSGDEGARGGDLAARPPLARSSAFIFRSCWVGFSPQS